MPAPTISELPNAPNRADPANFSSVSEVFVAALGPLVTQINALIAYLNSQGIMLGDQINGTPIGQNTPAAGKFTALEANSLDGAAVQASAIDAAVGKLLKLAADGSGAFGLGATTPEFIDDIDSHATKAGFYGVQSSTSGTRPPGGTNYGFLLVFRQSATAICQFYVNSNGLLVAYRTATGGTWDAWHSLYSTANLLGSVSQAAGVPTGAVIERGHNANGEYVRFADGTQICTISGLITSATVDTAWTYPAAFVYPALPRRPVVTGMVATTVGTGAQLVVRGLASGVSVNVNAITAPGARVSATAHLMALGRWF